MTRTKPAARQLSLEFLTAPEVSAVGLIEMAAEHGCSHVGLLVQPMRPFPFYDLLRDTRARRETRRRLDDLGIRVDVADAFNIHPDTEPESFRPAIESSAYLGATWINMVTRDPDYARLLDTFGGICEIAREYGLKVVTEACRRFAHDNLDNTVSFLKKLGDPDAKITLDALHFFRFGGTIGKITEHLDWIGHVQICDGAGNPPPDEQLAEARTGRLAPGDGDLPLEAFLEALPPHLIVGMEIPNDSIPVADRVARCVAKTREMVERVDRRLNATQTKH